MYNIKTNVGRKENYKYNKPSNAKKKTKWVSLPTQ